MSLALSCGGDRARKKTAPSPVASAESPKGDGGLLDSLNDEQMLLYELQEDYPSWARRRKGCVSTIGCRMWGDCSPRRNGRCGAETIMDCLWSGYCPTKLFCMPRDGTCSYVPPLFYPRLRHRHRGGHGEPILGFLYDRPVINRGARTGLCPDVPLEDPPYRGRNLLTCRWSEACLEKAMCRLENQYCRVDPLTYRLHFEREFNGPAGPDWVELPPPEIYSVEAARNFQTDLVGPPKHWRASRAPCGDTAGCFENGLCSPKPNGGCAAIRAIDCLFSTACRERGRCRPQGGRCIPGGRRLYERITPSADEHAARPNRDREVDPGCVVASNILECRHSHECAREGICYFDYGHCVAGSDTACRQSAICRKQDKCRFDPSTRSCRGAEE